MSKIFKEFTKATPTILYCNTSERYQKAFGGMDYKFIVYECGGAKKWDTNVCEVPSNHMVVKEITPNIQPDIVICQNKQYQYGPLKELAQRYKSKFISIEHSLPIDTEAERFYGAKCHYNVFFSLGQAHTWLADDNVIIIEPPVEVPEKKVPGIWVNNSHEFSVFYDVLEAMALGKCVVSPAFAEVANIINNQYTGFLHNINDVKSRDSILTKLSQNKELIIDVGNMARLSVIEKYSKETFQESWSKLIDHCCKFNIGE